MAQVIDLAQAIESRKAVDQDVAYKERAAGQPSAVMVGEGPPPTPHGAENALPADSVPQPPTSRLLGFVPLEGLASLLSALNTIPGAPVQAHRGPNLAALTQPEPETPLLSRDREAITASLLAVQRRLEVACQAGPFLPIDPAAACCVTDARPVLLDASWQNLAAALVQHGTYQQWDIILRWPAEPVVARNREAIAAAATFGRQALAEAVGAALRTDRNRREAALLRAISPVAQAIAAGGAAGADTELSITILIAAGDDAAVEAALDTLDAEYTENASIDMRGPLPPLSFTAVRLANVDPQAIRLAWNALDLPDRIDPAALHRRWRDRAAAAHPDRQNPARGPSVSELTVAYHLLRDLLPGDHAATLEDALTHGGPRLVIPVTVAAPELRAAL